MLETLLRCKTSRYLWATRYRRCLVNPGNAICTFNFSCEFHAFRDLAVHCSYVAYIVLVQMKQVSSFFFTIPFTSTKVWQDAMVMNFWKIWQSPFLSIQNDSLALPIGCTRFLPTSKRACYASDQSHQSIFPGSVAFWPPTARLVLVNMCVISSSCCMLLASLLPRPGNGPWRSCCANHPSVKCANHDTSIPDTAWPA